MGRTNYNLSSAGFVVDQHSIDLNQGRQIDWDNVSTDYGAAGSKVLPAGTCVGELLHGSKISPRVVTTNPAIGFLASSAIEGDAAASLSGYGVIVGAILYEDLLPDAASGSIAAGIKTELAVAGASKGFLFQAFSDSRRTQS